jgi:dolichol-phosphate mannosyltransferase
MDPPDASTHPLPADQLHLTVLVPSRNEAANIVATLESLRVVLRRERVPFELLVVDDNSDDETQSTLAEVKNNMPELIVAHNSGPPGLGRAIRCGIVHFDSDVLAIVMADGSDDPEDLVRCYRKIGEGYDCVFGSRFQPQSRLSQYPLFKLVFNRLANRLLQVLFLTRFNDLTNAFKLYRREVVRGISPLQASHFNITIEMSLSTLIRRYRIAQIPISWSGRTWGVSNLRLREMGRRYFCTMLMIWFERLLILDDVLLEKET